jgi:hypothetical protein
MTYSSQVCVRIVPGCGAESFDSIVGRAPAIRSGCLPFAPAAFFVLPLRFLCTSSASSVFDTRAFDRDCDSCTVWPVGVPFLGGRRATSGLRANEPRIARSLAGFVGSGDAWLHGPTLDVPGATCVGRHSICSNYGLATNTLPPFACRGGVCATAGMQHVNDSDSFVPTIVLGTTDDSSRWQYTT